MAKLKYIGPEKEKLDPYHGVFKSNGKSVEVPDDLARDRVINNPKDWAIDKDEQTPKTKTSGVSNKKMDYSKEGGK